MPEDTLLRKPEWIKIRPPASSGYNQLKKQVDGLHLHTVCQEANCPNISECWAHKTLTIMILGDKCTRNCRFCKVNTFKGDGLVDEAEPENTALMLTPLELRYVVITSVDRDDLADGGATHFANTVRAIRNSSPKTTIEILTGDFGGDAKAMETVALSGAAVVGHNLETVAALTPTVRDRRASYATSLLQLQRIKEFNPHIFSKSSLILGLGETLDDLKKAFEDLRQAKVDFLTLGQYLQPSRRHLPVVRYLHPDEFASLGELARSYGFSGVASGPLVRSSYQAGSLYFSSCQGANS